MRETASNFPENYIKILQKAPPPIIWNVVNLIFKSTWKKRFSIKTTGFLKLRTNWKLFLHLLTFFNWVHIVNQWVSRPCRCVWLFHYTYKSAKRLWVKQIVCIHRQYLSPEICLLLFIPNLSIFQFIHYTDAVVQSTYLFIQRHFSGKC